MTRIKPGISSIASRTRDGPDECEGRERSIVMSFRSCWWVVVGAMQALALNGCSDTLVYVERTAFSLAAVNFSGDVDEPINVNIGLRRSVIALAPPIGGRIESDSLLGGQKTPEGEATSMFSGFKLAYDPMTGTGLTGDLTIRTQFASGGAALEISGEPQIVKQIMDVDFVVPASPALQDRRTAAARFLDTGELGPEEINALARAIGEQPGLHAKTNVKRAIAMADPREFDFITQKLEVMFGRAF